MTPALPAGSHAAEARAGRIIRASLPNAVRASPPADVRSVAPSTLSRTGGEVVMIAGANLDATTSIRFGSHPVLNARVSRDGSRIDAIAPALAAGKPNGPYDVTADDSRGRDVLSSGVTYTDPRPVILRVAPSLVSTAGGTRVAFLGENLDAAHIPRLGGVPLTGKVFVNAARIEGDSPALPAGVHDADLTLAAGVGGSVARLPDAVLAAPSPTISSVEPTEVLADGSTPITITGTNFRPATRFRIGLHDMLDPKVSPGSATGLAPALDPGEPLGARLVTAYDSRGFDSLRGGVIYIGAPPLDVVPGPDEVESSLAEGTARFAWHNPVPYESIAVLDAEGRRLATLPGDATSFEVPSGGAAEVGIRLVGAASKGVLSEVTDALALVHQCERPPPLLWGGYVGDLNLTLRGKGEPLPVSRCLVLEPAGGGGAREAAAAGAPGAQGGGGIVAQETGYVIQHEFVQDPLSKLQLANVNVLITGFTLVQDADKLEIAGHYEKVATDFGLDLRARLVHVFPDDGFEDEFTFPDVLINQGKALNSITYFRANRDIGIPGIPDDPDPANRPAVSCNLPIPAGEYRLELYSVGGDPKLPYYIYADDPHDNEILIPGVPCPPYPLMRVTDVTGLRTLPDITEIKAVVLEYSSEAQDAAICSNGKIRIKLTAHGQWLDANNGAHVVPQDNSPHFEYCWKIHDRPVPTAKITHAQPTLSYCIPDWGCYRVDLEIRDKQCGFSKKRSYEVPIVPNPADASCPAPFTFLYPTPDPGGVFAVVDLTPPNEPDGIGSFSGKRPVDFRVLVVPQCYCEDNNPSDCPAALLGNNPATDTDDDIQFRLAFKTAGNGRQKVNGVKIEVLDLCPNVTEGAKYFAVHVEDLGSIPPQPGWEQLKLYDVFFQGRRRPANNNPDTGWRDVNEADAAPMRLGNPPKSLDHGFWDGHFLPDDQSYHFVTKSSEATEQPVPIGDTEEVDLGLPGLDVGIPSYNNNMATGFTSRFQMVGGDWGPETGSGTSSGNVMSNRMDGAPVQVAGQISGGGGGGGLGDLPTYEWCSQQTIFESHLSQTLFEAIIYTGTIGPVPVTIWGSIGLGLDVLVEAYTAVFVSPFKPLPSGAHAETHFYLLSSVDLAIPCEISADIIGGIITIALRLVPSAQFTLDTHVWSRDTEPHADFRAQALLDLLMEIEGCLDLLLFEVCATINIPLFENVELIDVGQNVRPPVTCSGEGGGAEGHPDPVAGQGDGEGAGVITLPLPYQSISSPVAIYSPDHKTVLDMRFNEQGLTEIELNGSEPVIGPGVNVPGGFLNPSAAFVSNTAALVAWNAAFCQESGLLPQYNPEAHDPRPPPPTLAQRNLMQAQREIMVTPSCASTRRRRWSSPAPPRARARAAAHRGYRAARVPIHLPVGYPWRQD